MKQNKYSKIDSFPKDKKLPEPPPLYDGLPTSIKIRKDPITNVSIPSDEAVEEVKRWSETNMQ